MLLNIAIIINILNYAVKQSIPWKCSWETLQSYLLAIIGGCISFFIYSIVVFAGLAILFSDSYWHQQFDHLFYEVIGFLIIFIGLERAVESFERCNRNRSCRAALVLCLILLMLIIIPYGLYTFISRVS